MKSKLPCCEINKKCEWINKTLECDHCECVFEKKEQLDDHNREIHEVQFTGKRKLNCCEWNEKKRQKSHHHSCYYCECTFQKKNELNGHMDSVHKCRTCRQILLTEDIRAQHKIKHEEEQRKRKELLNLQKQRDDDLVLNYVKTNKLDEYKTEPDYEPNFYHIVNHFDLEKEQLLTLVKKFDVEDILCFRGGCDTFTSEEIIYLLENDAVSVENVADFLNGMTWSLGDDEVVSELVEYFLDKEINIKREWVAKVINDDALIERIKKKYTYSHDEIYEARHRDSIFPDNDGWDEFYVQVHKHFPDPDFEDPFADPYSHFKCVVTEHVHDHLHNRYFYDEEDDKLSIVVGGNNEREISLGSCKGMFTNNLQSLIRKYNKATEQYDKANDEVSELFDKREEELNAKLTENQKLGILDCYDHAIYKDALPERNEIANWVSKLYFVISMKKSDTEVHATPPYYEPNSSLAMEPTE
ncbi:uncharacterized protein LOC116341037 [Contarinia nasturtii]|uniref:uncharacterized protein LOC116341037 n=1 Tax=Contarinia nasturtii TaxID=265458 RepID=UPI0012D44CA9|nr:uncharacterized protein LOC116341037 [Contarinia nasturtii]